MSRVITVRASAALGSMGDRAIRTAEDNRESPEEHRVESIHPRSPVRCRRPRWPGVVEVTLPGAVWLVRINGFPFSVEPGDAMVRRVTGYLRRGRVPFSTLTHTGFALGGPPAAVHGIVSVPISPSVPGTGRTGTRLGPPTATSWDGSVGADGADLGEGRPVERVP